MVRNEPSLQHLLNTGMIHGICAEELHRRSVWIRELNVVLLVQIQMDTILNDPPEECDAYWTTQYVCPLPACSLDRHLRIQRQGRLTLAADRPLSPSSPARRHPAVFLSLDITLRRDVFVYPVALPLCGAIDVNINDDGVFLSHELGYPW